MRKRLARRMTPQAICEAMCDHCLAPDTQACLSPVDLASLIAASMAKSDQLSLLLAEAPRHDGCSSSYFKLSRCPEICLHKHSYHSF